MSKQSTFRVAGLANITITNENIVHDLTEPRTYTFHVVVWGEARQSCHRVPMYIAACIEVGLQMTGLTHADACEALADSLESLISDNSYCADYLFDNYPPDKASANAWREHVRTRKPVDYKRAPHTWQVPDVCGPAIARAGKIAK